MLLRSDMIEPAIPLGFEGHEWGDRVRVSNMISAVSARWI